MSRQKEVSRKNGVKFSARMWDKERLGMPKKRGGDYVREKIAEE
jgi:hypothetical protein